ncbi:MAG: MJ1477/TM1410 family putative glycoside hydrolase [Desulfovibrio sp.]|uniref:MJ1477/TM1410 family putative glycoside hydrolase n=1 Tax=Desulfovibrio sp. 7SRBS1 TaxID=3378064 RepID=UPI003B3C4329
MKTPILLIACTFTLLLCGCSRPSLPPSSSVKTPDEARQRVTRWAYWLQHPDLSALAEYPADLVVIDYSYDGTDAGAFTRDSIRMLQEAGKKVLCYFSIGEAETYRFYWNQSWGKTPPSFLGLENPDWPGNYKVRYWQPQWIKQALEPYMDRILEAGFDGVYLDIIDAYWYWHETEDISVRKTADDMVSLVADIARYMRGRHGKNFIICPQNALGIINDASPKYKKLYLDTIDMVGVESLFFNIYSLQDQQYRLGLLKEFHRHNIPTLNIEYINNSQYAEYLNKLAAACFQIIPYPAAPDAALDSLTPADWRRKK